MRILIIPVGGSDWVDVDLADVENVFPSDDVIYFMNRPFILSSAKPALNTNESANSGETPTANSGIMAAPKPPADDRDCDTCEHDGDCYITILKCKGYMRQAAS